MVATFPVSFRAATANGKLAPQQLDPYERNGRLWHRPTPIAPFCSSTRVSIAATCPDTCRFKDAGCYEQSGINGGRMKKLDAAALGLDGDAVTALEAKVLDLQWRRGIPQDGPRRGGRPLRLHDAGDVASAAGAQLLAGAADRWLQRGGGPVWTYTARWAEIPRDAWGPIRVHASVQSVAEADEAIELGYPPAYTMNGAFPSARRFPVRSSRSGLKVIPCPAETCGLTCMDCFLCLKPLPKGTAVGFVMHGRQRKRNRLPVLSESMVGMENRAQEKMAEVAAGLPDVEAAVRDALAAMEGATDGK